ncbi:uncharacterized protein BT62DRAFT_324098 [Guyanagaster necrorhizus]|uniref:Uncharacterized protein n=1 Tax=Guyanagaster necrorhizus TaxID=856835 RepID=A0A9P7VN37_9AGAR|nr:uncharacterized protein BT62DRAFT_324098 [Guyanagaster necrorhizus MCA 3950]KAG7443672.1 hypothetical protein BT62DRAFT_324098 [Guyanagaster necrorhizus MCA 3950]
MNHRRRLSIFLLRANADATRTRGWIKHHAIAVSAANYLTSLFPKYINCGQLVTAPIGGWAIGPWEVLATGETFLTFTVSTMFVAEAFIEAHQSPCSVIMSPISRSFPHVYDRLLGLPDAGQYAVSTLVPKAITAEDL